MRPRKIMTVREYFDKYNRCFMKFGSIVAKRLADEALLDALAEKDLEKLSKVWKVVMEMVGEFAEDSLGDKMAELIGEYHALDGEADE